MADIVHELGEYTIQNVGPDREVSFEKDGKKVSYKEFQVQFEGIADWVKLNVGNDKPAPKAGETLKGHIEDTGKYGFKFVKERSGGGWGGSGGGQATPGAQWSAAYQTAAVVLGAYFQVSGTKPKDIKEFLGKLDQIAPVVKGMVDKRAGSNTEKKEEDKGDEKPAPKPAESKPADKGDEPVNLDQITDEELGDW